MFHFKDNDPAYIIHSISGAVFFEDDGIKNVEECMIERNKIDKEFQKLFENSVRTVKDNEPSPWEAKNSTCKHINCSTRKLILLNHVHDKKIMNQKNIFATFSNPLDFKLRNLNVLPRR